MALWTVVERQEAEGGAQLFLDAGQDVHEGGPQAWVLLPAMAHQLLPSRVDGELSEGTKSPPAAL